MIKDKGKPEKKDIVHTLHLYASNVNKHAIQVTLISAKKGKVIYITDDSHAQVSKSFEGINNIEVVAPENLDKLRYSGLRIFVDGGSINSISPLLLEEKIEKLKLSENNFITCMYPISKFDKDTLKHFVLTHDDLILTTEDKIVLSSKEFKNINLSEETLEKFVKNHLETVMLALLFERPMCGTDIIKAIHKKFNVLLSPAAIYPLLHTMMENGMLSCNCIVKKKIYKTTEDAGYKIKDKINEQIHANEMLVKLLETGGKSP